MAVSLVDAIGVASAGLTLIGFLQSNFAERNEEGATVRIKGTTAE